MIYFTLILNITSCFNESCEEHNSKVIKENFYFQITKKEYIYSHNRWLSGISKSGVPTKFSFSGFFHLSENYNIGDSLKKDSGSYYYYLIKPSITFIYSGRCGQAGLLVDSIIPKTSNARH